MTIRLRGHHLLCILTYRGEGYSEAFTANFDRVVARIAAGEAIEIIEGPDDICACLLKEKSDAHCLNESVLRRDALALQAIANEGVNVKRPLELNAAQLSRLRGSFAQDRIRAACAGCEWHGLCTQIAEENYKGARLQF